MIFFCMYLRLLAHINSVRMYVLIYVLPLHLPNRQDAEERAGYQTELKSLHRTLRWTLDGAARCQIPDAAREGTEQRSALAATKRHMHGGR